jgi:hypothetical protein
MQAVDGTFDAQGEMIQALVTANGPILGRRGRHTMYVRAAGRQPRRDHHARMGRVEGRLPRRHPVS